MTLVFSLIRFPIYMKLLYNDVDPSVFLCYT